MKKNIIKTTYEKFKKYTWILLVIVVFLGVRWFYTRDGIKTVVVKVINPEQRIVEKTVSTSGKIKSQNSADLSFNTTGRIYFINVKKGDSVKKGTLLARLDTRVASQNVQYYQDSRDIAIRNRELFIEQYDKNREKLGGENDYQITLKKNNELVSQAEAAYQGQLDTLRNSYIYAPIDGVIIDVKKEVGESASLGETIIKIENLNNIVFEVELDQEDYGLVKLGQSAKIELDAYSNIEFDGEVSLLPMYTDSASGSSFIVEISVKPTAENKPLIGMTGDAKIIVSKTSAEVPSLFYDEILFDEQNKPYVYVLNGELIKKKNIEIGLEGDVYTEIKSIPEEKIITGINKDIEINEGYKAKISK